MAAETRRSIAVVDETLGDTTIINERGVNPTDVEWAAVLAEVVERLSGARVLVVSGSVPPERRNRSSPCSSRWARMPVCR